MVGLTGGIGSGKTVVSDHFKALGVPIIDTDIIARDIVRPGKITLKTLVQAFGHSILLADTSLDRNALRTIAFANDENKALLDSITHPAIRTETLKQVSKVNYSYCIIVVPLLTKNSEFGALMQRILVVTAEHNTKVKRVQERSNLSPEEVERIINTQPTDEQRLGFADDVITNDGSIASAHAKVEQLHSLYLEQSKIKYSARP